jgi:hypothetical protein
MRTTNVVPSHDDVSNNIDYKISATGITNGNDDATWNTSISPSYDAINNNTNSSSTTGITSSNRDTSKARFKYACFVTSSDDVSRNNNNINIIGSNHDAKRTTSIITSNNNTLQLHNVAYDNHLCALFFVSFSASLFKVIILCRALLSELQHHLIQSRVLEHSSVSGTTSLHSQESRVCSLYYAAVLTVLLQVFRVPQIGYY